MIGTGLPHKVQLSPNVGDRKAGQKIDTLILHYTGMSDATKACDWLCNEESEVSCHYLVDEQGGIVQMVDEQARAWHAGLSSWHGEEDMNSASIGIEIQNPGHFAGYPDFPQGQMLTVIALCKDIIARHGIAARRVLAHSDVAPGRKIDPGEAFDWEFLARLGIGQMVVADNQVNAVPDLSEAQRKLQQIGYGVEATGSQVVLEAMQRRYRRSNINGQLDEQTFDILNRLKAIQPGA